MDYTFTILSLYFLIYCSLYFLIYCYFSLFHVFHFISCHSGHIQPSPSLQCILFDTFKLLYGQPEIVSTKYSTYHKMANDAMNRGEISAVVIRLPSDRANHVALTEAIECKRQISQARHSEYNKMHLTRR